MGVRGWVGEADAALGGGAEGPNGVVGLGEHVRTKQWFWTPALGATENHPDWFAKHLPHASGYSEDWEWPTAARKMDLTAPACGG